MRLLHLIWRLLCCCHQLIDNFVPRYKSRQAKELMVDIWSVLLASALSAALKLGGGFGLQLESTELCKLLANLGLKQRGGRAFSLVSWVITPGLAEEMSL